ncbi:MAG: flippase [Actinobacteria bacterium]|nr:flippase [Actinomycetota bacterium]
MTDETEGTTGAAAAGHRAAKNTATLAVGEIVGKVASFVLFAVLARKLGDAGLGVYVLAFAYLGIATMPVQFGFGRHLLRKIAKDRTKVEQMFDVMALQVCIAVPVTVASFAVLQLFGYDREARLTIYVLMAGFLIDTVTQTMHAVFLAFERSELLATAVLSQRAAAAAMGLVALLLGFGIVAVAVTYTASMALGAVLTTVLFGRAIGLPGLTLNPRAWKRLVGDSLPFAVQDVFSVLLYRVDTVILALLATQAAVGHYGAAYRLLEATWFLPYAVVGSFAAMYAYLGNDTAPTIQAVFQRSVKLVCVIMAPVAVLFGTLADDLVRLLFGEELAAAADPLRLLAPIVLLTGVIVLCSSLIVSRRSPRPLIVIAAATTVANIGLNLLLIPRYEDMGAALAMLTTESLLVCVMLTFSALIVTGLDWVSMLASPLASGAGMVAVTLLLRDAPLLAGVVGVAVYVGLVIGLERVISPVDLHFAGVMVRRLLPWQLAK